MKKSFIRLIPTLVTLSVLVTFFAVSIAPVFAAGSATVNTSLGGDGSITFTGSVSGVDDTTLVQLKYGKYSGSTTGTPTMDGCKDFSFNAPLTFTGNNFTGSTAVLDKSTNFCYIVVDTGNNYAQLKNGFFNTSPTNTTTNSTNTTKTGGANVDITKALQIPNPLKGATDLNGYIAKILDSLILIVTPFLVVMFLYSAFLFVSAQGNGEKLSEAKKALMYTLVGVAIVFAAKGLSTIIGNTVKCLADNAGCK